MIFVSYSTSVFQILKIIQSLEKTDDFDYREVFDLKKLNISEDFLIKILQHLIEEDYIENFDIVISGDNIFSSGCPELTREGILYLEKNTTMKKAYKLLKEIKGWIPGF